VARLLIPTVIEGLKTSRIGCLGLDVYKQEDNLFFQDLSDSVRQDDVFERLPTFPNVIISCYQGFLQWKRSPAYACHIAEYQPVRAGGASSTRLRSKTHVYIR
jgi:hypothetical protein